MSTDDDRHCCPNPQFTHTHTVCSPFLPECVRLDHHLGPQRFYGEEKEGNVILLRIIDRLPESLIHPHALVFSYLFLAAEPLQEAISVSHFLLDQYTRPE